MRALAAMAMCMLIGATTGLCGCGGDDDNKSRACANNSNCNSNEVCSRLIDGTGDICTVKCASDADCVTVCDLRGLPAAKTHECRLVGEAELVGSCNCAP